MAEYKQPIVVPNADIGLSQDPNKLKSQELNFKTGRQRVSAGDPARNDVKTDGIRAVVPFKKRGSKTIENWDDAIQAAINMSEYLS